MRACAKMLILAVLLAGCGSEYPEEPVGGRVRGVLSYQGDALGDIERPAVGVYAFTVLELDPQAGVMPSAYRLYEPDFGPRGISYELANLEAGSYDVIAQLIDLDRPPGEPVALGAYPNLLQAGTAPVEVTMEAPTEDIDIELYDMGP